MEVRGSSALGRGARDREEGLHERALVVTWRTGTHMLAIITAPAPCSSSSAICDIRLATLFSGKFSVVTLSGTRPASFSPFSAHSMGGSQVLENLRAVTRKRDASVARGKTHPTSRQHAAASRSRAQWLRGAYQNPAQQARRRRVPCPRRGS